MMRDSGLKLLPEAALVIVHTETEGGIRIISRREADKRLSNINVSRNLDERNDYLEITQADLDQGHDSAN
ncbi:hypothetical protein [Candidatus Amarolinea dominans]|uniref:hypothetical protein n=1 Tax=Candidatus Amarolinea dominans TaxID=3140696 RepID=UPI0031370165|nr:hypothetical protein [Anaerolineae bacterium]